MRNIKVLTAVLVVFVFALCRTSFSSANKNERGYLYKYPEGHYAYAKNMDGSKKRGGTRDIFYSYSMDGGKSFMNQSSSWDWVKIYYIPDGDSAFVKWERNASAIDHSVQLYIPRNGLKQE